MQIREGAYYRTRGGDVVGPMRKSNDLIETDYPWISLYECWTEAGKMNTADDESEADLISEVYVSDTGPTIITVTPGSSGGGGGMTPDTPRVGFAPPDQRQTADAPAPEAKTLRDEFAMVALQGLMADPQFKFIDFNDHAEALYCIADAMMEARKK